MKKRFIMLFVIMVFVAVTAMAIGRADTTDETRSKILASAQNTRRLGGLLEKPGIGTLAFLKSQKTYGKGDIESLSRMFAGQLHVPIRIVDSPSPVTIGNAAEILSKTGVTVGIFFVDDERMPLSLVAAEERWAIINTLKVARGAANGELAVKRLQREISRTVKSIFLNGTTEKGEKAVRTAEDLEKIRKDPIDGQQLFTIVRGLPSYDLVAPRIVPYKLACEEGWAPAPTNEYQKAIWDETHAIPANPMKIEFDPKKGR